MINAHTHIFTQKHVPDKFLPEAAKWLADRLLKKNTAKFFKKLKMNALADLSYRYYTFKAIGEIVDQNAIFKHLRGFYPEDTSIVVLSMDMEYMGAGKVPESFELQLKGVADLKKIHGNKILPFVFAHPERPNILDIVKKHIEDPEAPFSGIKIYPALGYFPTDPRLDEVFAYAEVNQIPVMTHCTRGGVFYKGKLTVERRTDPADGKEYPKAKNSKFTEVYSDPDRYRALLNKYPKLKICFAHFGGAGEWDKYLNNSWHGQDNDGKSWFSKVKELLIEYDNVYTDVSYTLYDSKYYGLLKTTLMDSVCRKKVLFGTDYYMLEQEISERAFGINLRGHLGQKDFDQISITNAKAYLNL